MSIRLVDAGKVSALRSQTLYHGVAHTFTKDTPKTIMLARPEVPYVCVGFHQELEKTIDVTFCAKNNLPVVRRELGGGAVYLDHHQLFTQWIFPPDAIPMKMEERFRLHAYPIVATYQALGIHASFCPINDILVGDKKIGGMGAAAIGNAEVLVCNFMADFDIGMMASILKISEVDFRDKIYQSLQIYMTTMKKELEKVPDWEVVKKIYLEKCEQVLKDNIEEAPLTDVEIQMMEELDLRFASESWLWKEGGYVRPAVKIHSGVWVGNISVENGNGSVSITLRIKDNHIDDITFPEEVAFGRELKSALLGTEISQGNLSSKIEQCYQQHDSQISKVKPQNLAEAITTLARGVS